MPRPRFQNLTADKRQLILAAAAKEFADYGYEQASLNRIIRKAKISKGAFYYYFDDKADLYGTVLTWAVDAIAPRPPPLMRELHNDTFWPEIEAWMTEVVVHCSDRPWLAKLGRQFHHPPPVATEVVSKLFAKFTDHLASYLARAQQLQLARSDLPDGLLLAMLMATLEASDRWMTENWTDLEDGQVVKFTKGVMQSVSALIAPPREGGPA